MRALLALLTVFVLAGCYANPVPMPMPKRPLYHWCQPYKSMKCKLAEHWREL